MIQEIHRKSTTKIHRMLALYPTRKSTEKKQLFTALILHRILHLHGGFLPRRIFARRILPRRIFARRIFARRTFVNCARIPHLHVFTAAARLQVAIFHYTSDVIGVICRIRGAVIQLATLPWLCFKCLFTLPLSCVMFQKSVTKVHA